MEAKMGDQQGEYGSGNGMWGGMEEKMGNEISGAIGK